MNVTPAEFARHIGKTRQYVNKLIRSGKVPATGGRIDLEKGLAALAAQHDPARDLRPDNPQESSALAGLGYYEARAIGEQIRAKREKLKLDCLEGRLLDLERVSLAGMPEGFPRLRALLGGKNDDQGRV